MKNLIIILSILLIGCTSAMVENLNLVSENYKTVVFDDGISLKEANIIAQQELINKNFVKLYDMATPEVLMNTSDLPNAQEYWFINFKEQSVSSIPYVFTAIIHKITGRVKFSDDYAKDNLWVLEAALLK